MTEARRPRLLCGSSEAAEMLDVSPSVLRALARNSQIASLRIGSRWKYRIADIEAARAHLAAGMRPPRPVNEHFTPSIVQRILERSRTRARLRRMDHALTLADIEAMIERSAGYCELTGIPFSRDAKPGADPWQPSLDRKDASRGYMPDNCRLVCYAVNLALNEWGEDVLRRIAIALVKR